MPSENYYFIDQNNTPQGPYTLLRLRAFYNAGDIKADNLVCQEGGEKWVSLESLFAQPKRKSIKQFRLLIELLVKLKTIFASHSLVSFSCGVIGGLLIALVFSYLTSHTLSETRVPTSENHEKSKSFSKGVQPANLPVDVVKAVTLGQKKAGVEYQSVTLLQIASRPDKYESNPVEVHFTFSNLYVNAEMKRLTISQTDCFDIDIIIASTDPLYDQIVNASPKYGVKMRVAGTVHRYQGSNKGYIDPEKITYVP